MIRTSWLGALAIATTFACARPTPEQQIVNDAAGALGGREAVLRARSLTLTGEGLAYNLGQDVRPDASTQSFAVTGYRRLIDLTARRQRTDQTRTPQFAYFQGQAPQRQVAGLDGDVAYNVTPTGVAARASATVAADRRVEYYHHPLTFLQAALAPPRRASRTSVRTDRAARSISRWTTPSS